MKFSRLFLTIISFSLVIATAFLWIDKRIRTKLTTPPIAYSALVKQTNPQSRVRLFRDFVIHEDHSQLNFGAQVGLLSFDANGDRKPDLLILKNGFYDIDPFEPTKRYEKNSLLINHTKSGAASPKFQRHIRSLNNCNPSEFLYQGLDLEYCDAVERPSTVSQVAVAADLNGDGLLDLIIGNGSNGSPWLEDLEHPSQYRAISPPLLKTIDRKFPAPALARSLWKDSLKLNVDSTNLILINQGDKDKNGFPEWKPLSKSASAFGRGRNTTTISVADVDLDGDLDFFEGNIMHYNLWPAESNKWSGAKNFLYLNQISESGSLSFIRREVPPEIAIPKIKRYFRWPFLPKSFSFLFPSIETFIPEQIQSTRYLSESGNITWSSHFVDVNHDGYPDLILTNDLGKPTLYINNSGIFEVNPDFSQKFEKGSWLSISSGDLNGDMVDDFFIGSGGGAPVSILKSKESPYQLLSPSISGSLYFHGKGRGHEFLNGSNNLSPFDETYTPGLHLSPAGNKKKARKLEPAWTSNFIDVDNSGKVELFFGGSFYGKGGMGFPFFTGPNRLLMIKSTNPDLLDFEDWTEISGLNLFKDDGVYYTTTTTNSVEAISTNFLYPRSMFQGENVRSSLVVDINNDGRQDIITRSLGYYSNPDPVGEHGFFVQVEGTRFYLPHPDPNNGPISFFEKGKTRVYLNTSRDQRRKWIKIELMAKSKYNKFAVGAKVIVNDKWVKTLNATSGSFGTNHFGPLHFGIGDDGVEKVEVMWPNKLKSTSKHYFNKISNRVLKIYEN